MLFIAYLHILLKFYTDITFEQAPWSLNTMCVFFHAEFATYLTYSLCVLPCLDCLPAKFLLMYIKCRPLLTFDVE